MREEKFDAVETQHSLFQAHQTKMAMLQEQLDAQPSVAEAQAVEPTNDVITQLAIAETRIEQYQADIRTLQNDNEDQQNASATLQANYNTFNKAMTSCV